MILSPTAQNKPRYTSFSGLSLIEMTLALAIFAVIVFPLVAIPMHAVDQSTTAKYSSELNYELLKYFGTLQHDVNSAEDFMILPFATDTIYLGYYDAASQKERRVGYDFRELIPSTGGHYNPTRWELIRADIPFDADVTQYYSINNINTWRSAAGALYGGGFYIQGGPFVDSTTTVRPYFLFCKGSTCSANIVEQDADGVRIQLGNNGAAPSSLTFVHQNSQTILPPLYIRLGSAKSNLSPSKDRIQPFTIAFSSAGQIPGTGVAYSPFEIGSNLYGKPSWMEEIPLLNGTGTIEVPVKTINDALNVNNITQELSKNDFYFNYKTQQLLTATDSPTAGVGTSPQKALYIFQNDGRVDGDAYSNYLPQGQFLTSTSTPSFYPANGENLRPVAGSDMFWSPLVMHQGDNGWPNQVTDMPVGGWGVHYLSITQTPDNTIYVLVQTKSTTARKQYWIEKITMQSGGFNAVYYLIPNITQHTSEPIGITFNPSAGNNDILVLEPDQGSAKLLGYQLVGNQIISSPTSYLLPSSINGQQLDWTTVRGVDVDPLDQRYLFVFGSQNADASSYASITGVVNATPTQILSVDANYVNRISSDPAAELISNIYTIRGDFLNNSSNPPYYPIINPTGIAYNPLTNEVMLSTASTTTATGVTNYEYFSILPSTRLNAPPAS